MSSQLTIPDIGEFEGVPVIEILVSPGDTIAVEDPLVVLESDKATMEVPSPVAGIVRELKVAVGDHVSAGDPMIVVDVADDSASPDAADGTADASAASETDADSGADAGSDPDGASAAAQERAGAAAERSPQPSVEEVTATGSTATGDGGGGPPRDGPGEGPEADGGRRDGESEAAGDVYASPSVRRRARQAGIDLATVVGSGPKGRITVEDLEGATGTAGSDRGGPGEGVRSAGAGGTSGGDWTGLGLAPWPQVDFERFGPVERVPLTRIQRLSGGYLARNWVRIPHVTHNEDADITETESFRREVNEGRSDVKVTMVALLLKACAATLARFPTFNSSLDGEELVIKGYHHIGFAADTPNGLVVPVIRDVDGKGLIEVARELGELSGRAREGKLSPSEMSGATFTISSLGGIGGTSFTPIINAPEVAILGVVRAATRPVWDGESFSPRLILPLSLSYDHRVIDGASAARFCAHLAGVLGDLRRILL